MKIKGTQRGTTMKLLRRAAIGATLAALAMIGAQSLSVAAQDRGGQLLKTDLHGFEEPPAVSSTGNGTFEARVGNDESSFDYELNYQDLEGTITQSHIHIGQFSVNGGIAIWLCQTAGAPAPASVAAATPFCQGTNDGSATGTVTAAQVIGPAGQGIAAGEFEEVLRAMREGVAYVNVHSTRNPGGEIRGQIRRSRD